MFLKNILTSSHLPMIHGHPFAHLCHPSHFTFTLRKNPQLCTAPRQLGTGIDTTSAMCGCCCFPFWQSGRIRKVGFAYSPSCFPLCYKKQPLPEMWAQLSPESMALSLPTNNERAEPDNFVHKVLRSLTHLSNTMSSYYQMIKKEDFLVLVISLKLLIWFCFKLAYTVNTVKK